MTGDHTRTTGLLLLIVSAAVGLYLLNLNPARFGSYHDDGIYLVTAKALATGQGYRIISLPDAPAQTKYPPLYPFLLSLVWRVFPNFPGNLRFLMLVSVVMTALFLLLSYAYFVRGRHADRGVALLIVGLMAFNWRVMLLSVSLYSELTYMALSLAALWAAERYLTEEKGWLGGMAGALLGLTFLTRTIGITLVAATAAYFMARRQYKKLGVLVLVSALFIGPWLAWQRTHRSPLHTPAAVYYTDYAADLRALVTDPHLLSQVIVKNLFYSTLIFTPMVSLALDDEPSENPLFFPLIIFNFALIVLGVLRRWLSGARLPDVYVAFYFGMLLIWPYLLHGRFLVPLLPFLLLYMVTQGRRFLPTRAQTPRAGSLQALAPLIFIVILVILGSFGAYRYAAGLSNIIKGHKLYKEHAQLERPVLDWIDAHTAPTDVLLAYRDPVVYLYTGRHTSRSILLYSRRYFYSGAPSFDLSETRVLFDLVRDSRANYLILTGDDFNLDFYPDLVRKGVEKILAESPQIFHLVYETPQSFAKVYRIESVP